MKYSELDSLQKQHVNGVLSQFMDNYIRTHLIWTPEQMYEALYEMVDQQHKEGCYGLRSYKNGKWEEPYVVGSKWITSPDAKSYIIGKFETKYQKNKKLARKDSPLIERARFGLKFNAELFYDINYGLQNGHCFQKTENVENSVVLPWSIDHVERELSSKYNTNLRLVLEHLSTSPIEIMFFEHWFQRYYGNKNNPAIIPEFCGDRQMYYCFKDLDDRYTLEYDKDYQPVNVRFDFAVVNFSRQKMLLIELDGHDYHKTKDQRLNDSVKRAIATRNGWQLNVITGTQIHNDIDAVFNMMDDYFLAR